MNEKTQLQVLEDIEFYELAVKPGMMLCFVAPKKDAPFVLSDSIIKTCPRLADLFNEALSYEEAIQIVNRYRFRAIFITEDLNTGYVNYKYANIN
jgi:hypothetical protein